MNKILQGIQTLQQHQQLTNSSIQSMQQQQQQTDRKVEELLSTMTSRIENLEAGHKNLEEAHKNHEDIIQELRKENEFFKKKLRENNIMIFGYQEDDNETPQSLRAAVESRIKTDMRIPDVTMDTIFRKGKRNPGGKPRPVVLKLVKQWDKERILRAKQHWPGVTIREDLTPEELAKRRLINDLVKKIKDQGREAYRKGGRVVVEGKEMSVEQAKALLASTRSSQYDTPLNLMEQ